MREQSAHLRRTLITRSAVGRGRTAQAMAHIEGHAGHQTIAALREFGIDAMFTLNGGHIWPFYEAARERGCASSTPATSSRRRSPPRPTPSCTRQPGLAVLDRRAGGHQRRLGGDVGACSTDRRSSCSAVGAGAADGAPGRSRSSTSLPILAPITKLAGTVGRRVDRRRGTVHDAARLAADRHRGPVFLDFPLDVFGPSARRRARRHRAQATDPIDHDAVDRLAGELIAPARAPRVPRRQRRLLGRRVV